MFPSKGMVEYISEMNRLFPRNEEEEQPTPFIFNPYQSPNQSAMVNKSSSTDSTSPESYPDLSFRSGDFRPQDSPRADSTFFMPRHRAIVGRKILGKTQQQPTLMSPVEKIDKEYNIWQLEEPLSATPPESSLQPKTSLYGLFAQERSFEFRSPVKEVKMPCPEFSPIRSPTLSSKSSERNMFTLSPPSYPPTRSQMSNQPLPMSLISQTWSNSSLGSTVSPQRQFTSHYSNRFGSRSSFGASSSTDEIGPTKMCTFCRKNGETPVVFMTHTIKEKVGNKNVVTCPILRSHVCTTCGASGDDAHTIFLITIVQALISLESDEHHLKTPCPEFSPIRSPTLSSKSSERNMFTLSPPSNPPTRSQMRTSNMTICSVSGTYCPVLRSNNNGKPLQSTTITLKNTRIKSNGRRRY